MARRRFPDDPPMHPCRDVRHVFDRVLGRQDAYGVVPIENSSGGTIFQTADILLDRREPYARIGEKVCILERLAVDVELALMARAGAGSIRRVYSHFAALNHCDDWLRENLPGAESHRVPSTTQACEKAASEAGAAAIGNREAADKYGLEVVHFPLLPDVTNITQFFLIGDPAERRPACSKTSLAIEVVDRVGSLADVLGVFARNSINLSRIISRPVRGQPGKYAFLIDIDGAPGTPAVDAAFAQVQPSCTAVRNLGSYPVIAPYNS